MHTDHCERMGSHFQEVEIPEQKHYNAVPLPYVVSPNLTTTTPISSLSHFVDSIKAEKPYLDSLLHKSGAVLFRGFPVNNASNFNDVVEAFGYEEYFSYLSGGAPRTNVVGRVYATESPLHLNVGFHHEMAHFREFPSKLMFFCEVEPLDGGETPIVRSSVVYEKMSKKYPDFVERLEEHGIIFSKVVAGKDDPSTPIGRGWQFQFSTDDKKVAEERAAKVGLELEWSEDGVRSIAGPIPAIRYDKWRNEKVWFNHMAVSYPMMEKGGGGTTLTFGDGEPLPGEIIHDSIRILEEESVAFLWQKGDVLLIDNWAILHSRRSCNPPRRVLASLCK